MSGPDDRMCSPPPAKRWGGVGGGATFTAGSVSRGYTPHPRPLPATRDARGGRGEVGSFHLDARGLDDRPPLFDLGFLVGAQRLRGLLLGWINLLPDLGEPLLHRRIGQAFHDGLVEFGDNVLRRAFRYPHPVPYRQIEVRQSGFVDGGNL